MKLLSLNTWGGRGGMENLLSFFRSNEDVDFFCLQEIWNGGEEMIGKKAGGSPLVGVSTTQLSEIMSVLPNHVLFFRPHFFDYYGLAILAKSELEVLEEGEVFVYKERGYVSEEEYGNHARNIQYVTVNTPKGKRTVINFHGLWNGRGKSDCDERLLQSENIISFLEGLDNPYVLTGDFNLRPDTQRLKKLEDVGLRNLISESGITSTRTSFYTKPEKFADYTFVSDGILVRHFKVLPDEVSDHSPLLLDFE